MNSKIDHDVFVRYFNLEAIHRMGFVLLRIERKEDEPKEEPAIPVSLQTKLNALKDKLPVYTPIKRKGPQRQLIF